MFGAGIDAQVTHLLAPQRPARDHALDRLFEHALGEAAFEHLAGGDALDAARIAGVPVIDLARQLVAGEAHLVDRKSTRLNSSHSCASRMPSSAWKKKTYKNKQRYI